MGLLDSLRRVLNQTAQNVAKDVKNAANTKAQTFTFEKLPMTLEELKALPEADLQSPFKTAALTVLALNVYPTDRAACIEMMKFLKGPGDLSPMEQQSINDRFMDGRGYIPRSYMKGAVPQNNYTPAVPYSVTVLETAHSRDTESEGYITLYIQSGGADSPRNIRLLTKPSTGQWFVNQFEGLLASIRIPVSEDKWA